ncbi:MAG: acyl-CoA dehydrogenase family protein [Hyphomicrobiales bacterium]
MSLAEDTGPSGPVLEGLSALLEDTVKDLDEIYALARNRVGIFVSKHGKIEADLLQRDQHATHGLAWLATYHATLSQLADYARRLSTEGRFSELEALLVQACFGEYLNQINGGIPMTQVEFVRPSDMGLTWEEMAPLRTGACAELRAHGCTSTVRKRITELMVEADGTATFGDAGLDETLEQMRSEIRRYVDAKVVPHAHEWHLKNDYVPLSIISEVAELGVFSLTLPEEYGGLAMGKESMCVVSEELSRGYIAVGSLGTRAEIAAELILSGGTEEQKQKWLPKIAAGEVLPTAVFTEPNTGSDLGSLRTRAVLDGDVYKITGNKTWITHPVRADVMTLLARTNPDENGYRGLSMFLAEKPRGTDEDPFPADGMSGGEIEVLGYRGMKEYEIAFDNFDVEAGNLLGGEEGQGFKQLMQTFEAARIQTASRAVGVCQNALELGMRYAQERIQFGEPIIAFPRISDKLAMIAVETMAARQLTYYSARQKDSGKRCDLEAGMAKLLGARAAWAAADNVLQIHGGNGFALEYEISRVLCDARILNIFEGAGEIQAQVIVRRLLEGAN